jgi:hypothetical protein
MATGNLEERLNALERDMKVLQQEFGRTEPSGTTRPEFLERVLGMYANKPMALSVLDSIERERSQEREQFNEHIQDTQG